MEPLPCTVLFGTTMAPSTTETKSHQLLSDKAVTGFANAALYDEHRPSYPPQAVAKLLEASGVTGVKGAHVLDLAAGTGKFTELLAQSDEHFAIVAVEPHEQMREQLIRKALRNVIVTDGLSTSIPAQDDTFDAVFAAQVRLLIILFSFLLGSHDLIMNLILNSFCKKVAVLGHMTLAPQYPVRRCTP